MYAPFGAGVLDRPAGRLRRGRPLPRRRRRRRPRRPRRGGLDRSARTRGGRLPERRSARSPCTRAIDALGDDRLAGDRRPRPRARRLLRDGLAAIAGCACSAPSSATETLPVATFTVDGVPHALVAARLAAEDAIGVRHGCFCAHPYLIRLLGLSPRRGRRLPGRRAAAGTAASCPAPCARVPASTRPRTTSSACSPRWPGSPRATSRRSATTWTSRPGISTRTTLWHPGTRRCAPTTPPAPPAEGSIARGPGMLRSAAARA